MGIKDIVIKGAREHNLKNIDVTIPRNSFTVISGLSGSGKSSLAFDTLYSEGQRRYVESLSAYARQFLGLMEKPDVDYIEGLSPAISIEQKTTAHNPRSTVGTVTEIHDYLRILFARAGTPHCHSCGKKITSQTVQEICDSVISLDEGTKFQILSPIVVARKGEYKELFERLRKEGYLRIRVDGDIYSLDEDIKLRKQKKHTIEVVIDRLINKKGIEKRLTESLETALALSSDGTVLIDCIDKEVLRFSEKLSCPDCEVSYGDLEPHSFSFNSPFGACEKCDGLGYVLDPDEKMVVPNPEKSLRENAVVPWNGVKKSTSWNRKIMFAVCRHFGISTTTSFGKLPKKHRDIILYGSGDEKIEIFNDTVSGTGWSKTFEGVIPNLLRRYRESDSDDIRTWIEGFMVRKTCDFCNGMRLRKESLSVLFSGKSIGEVSRMSIDELKKFFTNLKLDKRESLIAKQILKEINQRLNFLINVGISYLTLDRSSATLSGGESQRIRLATQIGARLVGVTYILDEPSIGLHSRDNTRLLNTLLSLRNLGNTVVVIEHDKETLEAADYLIDIGPGAGRNGGNVVATGTPKQVAQNRKSLTGLYLSGRKKISVPEKRREGNGKYITLTGASGHNLKNVSVKFPLEKLICVTGVSGSGKSSLVNQTLYPAAAEKIYGSLKEKLSYKSISGLEHIDKVIDIDQSPIGRTPRSNPATYTKTFDIIRDLFTMVPESKMRGYKKGRFSFNVKGGRCENCRGDGVIKIEMNFLPDVYVECETCKGKRYNRETLDIKYKGKTISDVLDMTVDEALEFFSGIPALKNKLSVLSRVGLGYIHIGQQATTLSGGEAQRIKLAAELSKKSTGNTLYILDEPTTGLHFEDVRMLMKVIGELVDLGNTVIIIEHNMDVIKCADWIIDVGPEGGDMGGYIIAEGTPEQVCRIENSETGKYLKEYLL